jgi:V/A-type H+-transporting ATPase subunit D
MVLVENINTRWKNIAGVEIPLFDHVDFIPAEYDLFVTPLWVDAGLERCGRWYPFRKRSVS